MPQYRSENGVKIQLTPEEEIEFDARVLSHEARQPLENWKSDMAKFKLSREVEDLITEGSLSMNAYQKTIYDAKVKRRSEKP
jgi:hypothetical protein